jgi:hypothetical protein
MPDDLVTETVRFAVDVEISYTTEAARAYCVSSARRDLRRCIYAVGAGRDGRYSMTSKGAEELPAEIRGDTEVAG